MKTKEKYPYKALYKVVSRIQNRPDEYEYQYYIIIMLMLRYFHQVFNGRVILVRGGNPPADLYYKTTEEQLSIYTFYLICEKCRWSYIRDNRKEGRLSEILYNCIGEMKNYFVHLEDIFSLLEDAPQLDDAHLGYMVGLIDRIDFYVDGKPDKECLADLLNYVLFLFSTR